VNILAIDTACNFLSLAAAKDGEIFYYETEAGTRHSEIVMDRIDELMKTSSLAPRDLEGVLCMGGPGSFTGLRIGFSIAKALALSLSIPFAPVPTLDCIAFACGSPFTTLAVIEARKNSYFFAIYEKGARLTEAVKAGEIREAGESEIARIIMQITWQKDEKIHITGPGALTLYNSLPDEIKRKITVTIEESGYARELIGIAKERNLLHHDNTAFLFSGPEYIRKTDAEINLGIPGLINNSASSAS